MLACQALWKKKLKPILRLLLGILACLVIAAGAYFWATGLMDSIYAYRSPLRDHPPAPGAPLGQPLTRRVVFVLVDALRNDTSLKPEVMPFLNELRQQGAWATMHSRPPSYSEPGYTVLLTGAWPEISDGPAVNLDYAEIPTFTQDDLFSAAHRAGLKTAVSGYYWFEKLIPQSAVDASFYTPGEDNAADIEVVDAALPWLEGGGYQLVLIHINQVDYAGHHEGGPRDPRWDAARRADDLLREIAASLDLSQDTLFVCSDHGQIDRGGHGGQDAITLVEPFVLAGAGVKAGSCGDVNMVDVAPTLAALLGANLPASGQGQVRSEMLALSAEQAAGIERAWGLQQSLLQDAYLTATGAKSPSPQPGDDVAAFFRAHPVVEGARNARLAGERWPRAILAVILAVAPAVVLFLKRSRAVAWMLGGAVLYVVIFNLRYAVIDGRTYSLSSVASANDLILYSATTALIALAVSWLAVSLGLGSFRQGPRPAAESTLGLALTTLYLLLLPVLVSFALNGATLTWTLPDFSTLFMAFISLVQGLMVAALGLLLTGVAALIGVFARKKVAS